MELAVRVEVSGSFFASGLSGGQDVFQFIPSLGDDGLSRHQPPDGRFPLPGGLRFHFFHDKCVVPGLDENHVVHPYLDDGAVGDGNKALRGGVIGIQIQPGQLAGMRPFRQAARSEIQGPGLGGGIYLFGYSQGSVQQFRILDRKSVV